MKNSSIPFDTQREAAIKQYEILRKMDISARAEMTFQLSDNLRSILESGIRLRHPEYNQDEVKLAALRLTIDEELFNQAFPDCEISA